MAKIIKDGQSVADEFIADAVLYNGPVGVYLVSGVCLKGRIVEADEVSFIMENGKQRQLIFRTGIASVVPQ